MEKDKKLHFTVSIPNNDPNYKKRFICLFLLKTSFKEIDLQKKRIEEEIVGEDLKNVHADIHFLLISLSCLIKIFQKLKNLLSSDKTFVNIYKRYYKRLDYLNDFRDSLEHITDGRIEGKDRKGRPLKNPFMLGNLINYDYDFGGERFNLKDTFSLLKKLQSDIKGWNTKSNYQHSALDF